MSFLALAFLSFQVSTAVPNIANGDAPKGKAYTLVFKEELRIEPDNGDDDAIWEGKFVSVDVDAQGNMYVTDGGGNRIVLFDAQGKKIKVIGAKGEGPGEFKALRHFWILSDGTGLAFENENFFNRFNVYDAQKNFKDRMTVEQKCSLSDSVLSPNGKQIAGSVSRAQGNTEIIDYAICDVPEMKVMNTFLQLKADNTFDYSQMETSEFWLAFIPSRLKYFAQGLVGYTAFDQSNHAFTAVGNKYEITKWTPEGKKLLTISRNAKAIPQSQEEIMAYADKTREAIVAQVPHLKHLFTRQLMEKAVEKSGFLPRKHPIYGLRTTDDGLLIVCHNVNELTQGALGDLFDKEGRYMGAFQVKNGALTNMVFKQGKAYAIETVNEEKHLVRYAYRVVAK